MGAYTMKKLLTFLIIIIAFASLVYAVNPTVTEVILNSTTNDNNTDITFYCKATDSDSAILNLSYIIYKNGELYIDATFNTSSTQLTNIGSHNYADVTKQLMGIGATKDHLYIYQWSSASTDSLKKFNRDDFTINDSFAVCSGNNAGAGVDVDSNFIYVVDSADTLIYLYNLDGSCNGTTFDPSADGFSNIRGLDIWKNYMFVSTPDGSGKVGVYYTNGTYTHTNLTGDTTLLYSIAYDDYYYYRTQYNTDKIRKYYQNNTYITQYNSVDDAFGELYANRYYGTRIGGYQPQIYDYYFFRQFPQNTYALLHTIPKTDFQSNDTFIASCIANDGISNSTWENSSEYKIYGRGTLNISIYDEITDSLINETMYVSIIGDSLINISNYTISTGNLNITGLVSDDYEIRYYNGNYPIRSYFFTMDLDGEVELDLFALNSTYASFVTFTTISSNGDTMEGAILRAKRLFPSRLEYKNVAMCKSDDNGECGMYLELLSVYSYDIYYNTETQFIDPYQLISTEKTFTFQPTNLVDDITEVYNIVYSLNYTGSGYFRYDFATTDGSQHTFCLRLYNKTYGYSDPNNPFTESCTYTSSGILLIEQSIANQTIMAVATVSSLKTILATLIAGDNLGLADYLGKFGLFLAFMILLTFTIIGFKVNVQKGIIMFGLGFIFIGLITILDIPQVWSIIASIIGILIITLIGVKDEG